MNYGVRVLIIDSEESGQRLDNYLLRQLKGAPKSLIYRIVRKGEVRVNKGRTRPDYKIKPGDAIRIPPVRLPTEKPVAGISPHLRKLLETAILFENEALIIINKPSGLASHGGSGVSIGLIEAMRQVKQECRYLELVHRLDKETSGCVMIAKKRSMLRHLQQLLREKRDIQKRYIALATGKLKQPKLSVNAPLHRYERPGGERVVRVDKVKGKPAKTLFSVLERFDTPIGELTFVEASPITGRTHQIRVHAQHLDCPLAGDAKYGKESTNEALQTLGCQRLFLHAKSLKVALPDTSTLEIEAPLPEDLSNILQRLRQ